jgi:SAM-dependent methyltransferase
VIVRSPLARYVFPTYPYNFTPAQLCFMCQCLEESRSVSGTALEVGCWKGVTTIFLVKYQQARGIDRQYYAIDTFAGFTAADIDFEAQTRGKDRRLFNYFAANSQAWFDATMRRNGVPEVQSIAADVNQYDLRTLGPVAFCLLDVDLYRPMLKSLRELYEALSPGGIIVVDDCDPTNIRWDGSDEAYRTFMAERQLTPEIVHGKLGIVRKPAADRAR